MIILKSTLDRLTAQIEKMISEGFPCGIQDNEFPSLKRLVKAVNSLRSLNEKSGMDDLSKQPQLIADKSDSGVLNAIISGLPQGIIVCNAQGNLILFNLQAESLFKNEFSIGKPITSIIDRTMIEHTLDEINEQLKHRVKVIGAEFVIEVENHHLLRIRMLPILDSRSSFSGFTLIANDITQQRKTEDRIDSLFRLLTQNARSPLASIMAANDAMIEYPDMDKAREKQFKEIIRQESVMLGEILNNAAGEYTTLIQDKRSLVDVSGIELMETISRRAKDRLRIRVSCEYPDQEIRIKADPYSLVTAVLFVFSRLVSETGVSSFSLRISQYTAIARLDLLWNGASISVSRLKHWEKQFLSIGNERSPLTLKEVISHHHGELWAFENSNSTETPYVRFFLPIGVSDDPSRMKPIMILPESQLPFYDLDLFRHSGNDPELDNRLLTELSYTALVREINRASEVDELMGKHSQLPRLIHPMITGGTKIRTVTWLITRVSDAILTKFLEFALKEKGTPPVPFAFVILGSEGRKEQTLKTDQDNAIVYDDSSADFKMDKKQIQDWFLSMGEQVCTWLDRAGYDFCIGGIMAKNPKWCQPLSVWKQYFTTWIHEGRPEDLLHSSIFFDFRLAFGDQALTDTLKEHLYESLVGWTGVFRHMTENAVYFKPPIGIFGNFILKAKGKYRKRLDVKSAMTPIVDFARIYALKWKIDETNTQDRLYQLYVNKVLTREEYSEVEQAYSFMMQIRFMRQIEALVAQKSKPDNYINPKQLSDIEQKMLKEVMKQIGRIQTRLSFEFLGTSDSQLG